MSAALQTEASTRFEALIGEGLAQARQGAVLVVEASGFPPARVKWLQRQLEQVVPGAAVQPAGEGLLVFLVKHAGPAESWLLGDRVRRQLTLTGWEGAVVSSASWPVQGSSPMEVMAAALAGLFDERSRLDRERAERDVLVEVDGQAFDFCSAGELLSG